MKILLFVAIAIAVCFSVYAASDSRAGVWTAELQDDKVQMTLFRGRDSAERHGMGFNNTMGFDDALSAYTGLTKSDLLSSAANVQFELRRPAGVIAFEGRVANGTGAGHYRFNPSDAFIGDMESLGYRGFSDDMLLVFAAHDFSPQTLRDLRAMGYQPTQHEVEEIAIFRVTPDFLREVGRLGYPSLTLREAVNFRVGRVDAAYINDIRALGYSNQSARQLADMAILGVSPAYIRELRSAGLTDLSARQLTDLRVGNVTAARIEEYRRLGYTNLSAHQLSEMGIFGVTPDYIRRLSEKGYDKVPIDKLLQLRTMGADKILFKTKEKD
ncbi:MAG: hypothetical protein M3041_06240 [Acidobacteriota bacterium]|nr:hypothetical protein [Acidobacteriota bacterium]